MSTQPKRDGDGIDGDDDDDDDASQSSSKKNRLEEYSRLCRDEVIARGEGEKGRSLPSVEIKCDFDYVLHLPANKIDRAIKTVAGVVSDVAMTLPNKIREKISGKENEATKVEPFRVLKDVDCCFKAGSMTLVLAPPGHGKTSLLKAIGQVLPSKVLSNGKGITYSKMTAEELRKEKDIDANRVAMYVTQQDEHLPFLTVRETTKFSHENSTPMPTNEKEKDAYSRKIDTVHKLLSLENCLDTIIGDDLVRGISGGEKKRVTIAEAMMTNARVFCMDEISTGLDAAVTHNIVSALREWTRVTNGTAIVSLLQPTPEVYELFDDLLCLRDGTPVYHGDVDKVVDHFGRLGFDSENAKKGDVADWLLSVLVDPVSHSKTGASNAFASGEGLRTGWIEKSNGLYEKSIGETDCIDKTDGRNIIDLRTSFAKAQYSTAYPRSWPSQYKSVIKRQFQITLRNKVFLSTRIFGALITSVVLGSVWFDLPLDRGFERLGMLLFAILHISFSNFSEMTFSVEQKYVMYKQLDYKLFPKFAYIMSSIATQLPIAMLETAIFSCILYPMVGLSMEFENWLVFFINLTCANVAMASFFRVVALLAPNMEAAQTFPGPVIAVMVIFAGFLISPEKMGVLFFLYWISLFAYSLRSLCQNEFLSDQYKYKVPTNPIAAAAYVQENAATAGEKTMAELCAENAFPCEDAGKITLDTIDISSDKKLFWAGPMFSIGFFCLMTALGYRALSTIRIQRNIGSSRASGSEKKKDSENENAKGTAGEVSIPISGVDAEASQRALVFTPMSITWEDLEYTVKVPGDDGKPSSGTKKILNSVTSAAQPSRMLALMGASGAGKSTLLDVIAGRKSGGEMKGTIKLNGHIVKKETFARLTAYCEQQDLHNAFTTVKEALEFSATLRLPSDVSKDVQKAFVDEALDILELRGIENRLVGTAGSPSGLSPGQRKILTVGVELVSNAPVFFLDEPTSGLDSRAALIVMREVKKVAALGRTVITTVHQPSKEIFSLFDDMLLLQRGGYQVYFGPCGANGKTFVEYLQKIPNVHALPEGMNPASWMLDVLGGTDSSNPNAGEKGTLKKSKSTGASSLLPAMTMKRRNSESVLNGSILAERFRSSQEGAAGTRLVRKLCAEGEKSEMFAFDSSYARSFLTQLRCLVQRASVAHNRDVAYNLGRIGILFVLYLLFGFIYFDLDASDETGVQAMVGVIFMTSIFAGIIFMNSVMPVRVRERTVAYRERTSFMYDAIPYSLSHAFCEVPWILLVTFVTVTPLYFMVGLVPTFEHYIFHVLMVFTVSMAFMSIGQVVACLCATIQTAQAGASAFIPICFLFGGLYLPFPQIPVYWKWAYYIDPVAYAVQGVVAPQFEHRGCTGPYPEGDCPTIQAFRGTYFETMDTLAYVEDKYDVQLSKKWLMLMYVAIFVICMQILHVVAFKFKRVVTR